jgi:methionine aminopeptidase
MSGPNGAFAGQTYNMHSTRVVQPGDLVNLELGVVADGYWSDLTRAHVRRRRAVEEAARSI